MQKHFDSATRWCLARPGENEYSNHFVFSCDADARIHRRPARAAEIAPGPRRPQRRARHRDSSRFVVGGRRARAKQRLKVTTALTEESLSVRLANVDIVGFSEIVNYGVVDFAFSTADFGVAQHPLRGHPGCAQKTARRPGAAARRAFARLPHRRPPGRPGDARAAGPRRALPQRAALPARGGGPLRSHRRAHRRARILAALRRREAAVPRAGRRLRARRQDARRPVQDQLVRPHLCRRRARSSTTS